MNNEPLIQAFDTWMTYSASVEDLVHLSHKGIAWALKVPELYRLLGKDDASIERAEWEADKARCEVESGFPTLHAHTLLGLCGAFEAFVEDLTAARLTAEPSLLESEKLERIKVPVSVMAMSDEGDRSRRIVSELGRLSELSTGATKYERLLDYVNLRGSIPDVIREQVFLATEVRNVWAHRGGRADRRFGEKCPKLGFDEGDRVDMSTQMFMPMMHSFHMYGRVILNRYLIRSGRDPLLNGECSGFKDVLQAHADDERQSMA